VAFVSALLASAPDLKGIKFMFKVGDRVRIKQSAVSRFIGVEGTVTGVTDWGVMAIWDDDNAEASMSNYKLELVSSKGKRGRPRTKAPKVNFLLKYDLDEDPIEEFETMDQVKERIDYLVKNESSLKKESMVVYEVKRKKVVSVETKITMK
jgi:hypothetical protein